MRRTSSLTTCCIGELYKEVRDFITGQGTFLCPGWREDEGRGDCRCRVALFLLAFVFDGGFVFNEGEEWQE